MSSRLQGARFKLVRSREHLDLLRTRTADYVDRRPYGQRADPNPPPGDFRIYAVLTEAPDPYWGTIVGDAVHNMRSALNYLACELVKSNGGEVKAATQFPIHRVIDTFNERGVKEIKGATGDAVAAVRRLQPYQVRLPDEHPLQILGSLSNADKHNYLPLAAFATRDVSAEFEAANRADTEILFMNKGEIEHDSLLLHGRMTNRGPSERVYIHFQFRTWIMIDGRVRLSRLRDALDYIHDQVFPSLESFVT